ncbi:hypothetical protein [Turicimonas sp. TL08]
MTKLRLTKRYRDALRHFLLPRYKHYEQERMKEDYRKIIWLLEDSANNPEYNVPVGFSSDHTQEPMQLERTVHCARHVNGTFLVQFSASLSKDFAKPAGETNVKN